MLCCEVDSQIGEDDLIRLRENEEPCLRVDESNHKPDSEDNY